jgi:hypothetical protein
MMCLIQSKLKNRLIILALLLTGCSQPAEQKIPGSADTAAWEVHRLRSSEICIVSHSDRRAGYAIKTTFNHEEYASRYGYSYQFLTGLISGELFQDPAHSNKIFREGLYWQKVTAVKKALDRQECRWVMWLDADTVFTNFTKKINHVIQEYGFRVHEGNHFENHLILSAEEVAPSVAVNAGVFLVRNSDWSKSFFQHAEEAYPYYKDHSLPEQDFLQDAVYSRIELGRFETYSPTGEQKFSFENLLKKTIVIPQRVMNSFHRYPMTDNTNAQWEDGDFIAHLSGSSNEQRLEMIEKLKLKIVR